MTQPTQPTSPPAARQPQPKSSAKKIVLIVFVVLLVLGLLSALGGYLIYRTAKNAANNAGINDINKVVKELEEYPDAYKTAGLPQYPGGKVASLSGKDGTIEEGISIIVSTSDAHQKVVDYFDQRLKDAGWTTDEAASPFDDNFFFRTYTKGDQEFALTVQTSENDETTATVFWGKSVTTE